MRKMRKLSAENQQIYESAISEISLIKKCIKPEASRYIGQHFPHLQTQGCAHCSVTGREEIVRGKIFIGLSEETLEIEELPQGRWSPKVTACIYYQARDRRSVLVD